MVDRVGEVEKFRKGYERAQHFVHDVRGTLHASRFPAQITFHGVLFARLLMKWHSEILAPTTSLVNKFTIDG